MKSHILKKPLIHPPIYLDENPIAYLIRIAELNKYASYRWLILNKNTLCMLKSFKSFYEVLDEEEWTEIKVKSALVKTVMATSPNHLISRKLRCCPLCIKKYGYYKINWQFRASIACSEHGVLLQDECHSCGRAFDTSHSIFTRCSCGVDVQDANVEKVSDEVNTMQLLIDNKGDKESKLLNTNDCLEHYDFLLLLNYFSRGLRAGSSGNSGVNNDLADIKTARDTMMDVAEALFAGEAGFRGYLSKLLKAGNESGSKNSDVRFTRFYQSFYKKFPQKCLSEYKIILEQFLNDNWIKPLSRRNRNFSKETIQAHPWLPLKQACREFDISKSLLRRSIDKHLVRSKNLVKEKRVITLLYKPDLMARIDRLRDYITAKEAREILGLTKLQFNQLCESQFFKLAVDPKESNSQSWQFSRNEICSYRDQLIGGVQRVKGEYWSFSQLLQFYGRQFDDPLVTLLNAIKNKDLKLSAVNKASTGLASMLIAKNDFLVWYEQYKEGGKLLSIPSLAKILGVNQEFTYQLVNTGVIETTENAGSDIKWISRKNILDFNKNYILSSKLSKKIQMNPRRLVNYLASREVRPIDHEWKSKLRQKVYKKEMLRDVEFLSGCL